MERSFLEGAVRDSALRGLPTALSAWPLVDTPTLSIPINWTVGTGLQGK